jgi:hypothetical protein
VVLLPSEPYPFAEADARELREQVPGVTPAVVKGEWVTWYGSRMPEAIEGLRRILAPHRG